MLSDLKKETNRLVTAKKKTLTKLSVSRKSSLWFHGTASQRGLEAAHFYLKKMDRLFIGNKNSSAEFLGNF